LEPEKETLSHSHSPLWPLALLGIAFYFASKLKTPPQQIINSVQPQADPRSDRHGRENKTPSAQSVIIDSYPPTPPDEWKTEQKCKRWRDVGSLVIALATLCVLSIYTGLTYGILHSTNKQLTVMQKQMELSERPWIKILDVKPRGDLPIGGLSFQKIGPFKDTPDIRVQASIQIELSFKNIGHSVADVTPNVELFMPQFSASEYWNRVSAAEQNFCASPGMSAVTAQKVTVFPDDPQPFAWYGGISTPIRPENTNHLPEGSAITPALIVCVSYRHKGLPSLYQTRAVFEISHLDTHSRFFDIGKCDLHPFSNSPMTFCEGGVPAKLLKFDRNNMGDDAY